MQQMPKSKRKQRNWKKKRKGLQNRFEEARKPFIGRKSLKAG